MPTTETRTLDVTALDTLFRTARTAYAWQDRPVSEELLREIYDLTKLGPTSANGSPARFVFVTSAEGKARILPTLMELNVAKAQTAPVIAIIAYDTEFFEQLPKLMPHADIRSWFVGNPAFAEETAFRNSSMQAAYFILAARALGLDAGPMSGFDAEKVNAEFFPDGKFKVNLIVNLGYGDFSQSFPRSPRLDFDEAATIL